MTEKYHPVTYGTHTSDDKVHIFNTETGESLCGLQGIFRKVERSDATEGGLCPECDGTEQETYD